MKKLFFAAAAALAMVSVSNAFAGKSACITGSASPADTTVNVPADTTESDTAQQTDTAAVQLN